MTASRSALSLIFIGLVGLLLQPYAAAAEPAVYKVFVDDWYGFKRVIEVNYTPFKYENQTLNINVGDTVIWQNDASDNNELTIISVQNLWDSSTGYLKYNYRSFNYTFTKPGSYEVYMKEYPRRPHQTIVVAPVGTPTVTTPSQTPTATETATPTAATVTQTPQTPQPEVNLVYILIALVVIVGIVALWFSIKK